MQMQLDVYEDGMTDDHEEIVNAKKGIKLMSSTNEKNSVKLVLVVL